MIDCVGKDEKLHFCEPHGSETLCGKPIKSKKLQRDDWKRYNCWECDGLIVNVEPDYFKED